MAATILWTNVKEHFYNSHLQAIDEDDDEDAQLVYHLLPSIDFQVEAAVCSPDCLSSFSGGGVFVRACQAYKTYTCSTYLSRTLFLPAGIFISFSVQQLRLNV